MPQQIEFKYQCAVIQWSKYHLGEFPELEFLFATNSPAKLNPGQAGRNKAFGIRAGVPDLFLPVARGPYHGLFIELKSPKGRATIRQLAWINGLQELGYKAEICHDPKAAMDLILEYLRFSSQ